MLSKVLSATVLGIDAYPVEVEVDITAKGLPHFSMVGLPDAAVKESKDRVRAALKNVGFNFPLKQITVNLAPADLKKEGSSFDLPIALGIVASESVVAVDRVRDYLFTGELSLDGTIKPVRGTLSIAMAARNMNGLKGVIVPRENAAEAATVRGVDVFGARNVSEVIDFLNGVSQIQPHYVDINDAMKE